MTDRNWAENIEMMEYQTLFAEVKKVHEKYALIEFYAVDINVEFIHGSIVKIINVNPKLCLSKSNIICFHYKKHMETNFHFGEIETEQKKIGNGLTEYIYSMPIFKRTATHFSNYPAIVFETNLWIFKFKIDTTPHRLKYCLSDYFFVDIWENIDDLSLCDFVQYFWKLGLSMPDLKKRDLIQNVIRSKLI